MDKPIFYCAGSTAASRYTIGHLQELGYTVCDQPCAEVTGLILDVPSFQDNGSLRGGGNIHALLAQLPEYVSVFGGNLHHVALKSYRTIDLLQDPDYVAQNAYITAECALQVAAQQMTVTFRGCPVLVIGWGRIGKCLGQLLKALGADVTIAARKQADRAMICAMGYHAIDTGKMTDALGSFRLVFNTAPSAVLSREQALLCSDSSILIDLASKPGILGEGVIRARGLPGIHTPESSGILIAKTIIRQLKEA